MKRVSVCVALGLLIAAGGCGKTYVAEVPFSYTVKPKQPLSEQYMKIAVRNANMGGDTTEYDQKKWSGMTADLIQYSLQRAADRHGVPIKLVDREHIKLALEEKDLAAAGITGSGDEVASAQLAGTSAIITSKVTIKIDKQKGKGRTISSLGAIAGRWGGGGHVGTSEVEKESRNITVQCQFQLKDPATNDIVVSYVGEPAQHFTKGKTSPFFGGSKTESDMTPRDKVIGDMIDRQLRGFMAKFVPTEVETVCTVKSSRNEMSVAGVRAMVVADNDADFEAALGNLRQAISEDPDDQRSLFAAGVCCEKLKRYDRARKYYKQARALKPKEGQYREAISRIDQIS